MRKKLALAIALVCAFSCLLGCGSASTKAFKLAHYNGVAQDGVIDSAYFYRNEFTLFGGDSQVIYVSEEQSPEYGGWYYQYNSGSDGVILQTVGGSDPHKSVISCLRSKDLSDWELCGAVDNGFAVRFETNEWPIGNCWAPETIYNPADGKYYMYFSAEANPNPEGDVQYDKDTSATGLTANFNRFFIAICVSDTPVGPFKLVTSENYYGDEFTPNPDGKIITTKNPAINPKYDMGLEEIFAIIDTHPFFDGDDLYLYFVRHVSSSVNDNSIWGMKMKDMITPDYSTARMLVKPNWRVVQYKGSGDNWDVNNYNLIDQFVDHSVYVNLTDKTNKVDKDLYGEEYHINEGPFMWKHDGRYYLTYSPQGVGQSGYQVRQALGSSPLGTFEKPTLDPATMMGANEMDTTILGTGHHCFIEGGAGELFCVSWPNATPFTNNINETGRAYAVDRVHFIDDPTYGVIMTGGPTVSLQAKPYSYTGRVNVAKQAKITATNAENDTVRYLNDEVVVFRKYFEDKEFVSKGKTTITLSWNEPVEIAALLIYNSYDYNYAFRKIDRILFSLAEKPAWFTGSGYRSYAAIENLPFNSAYVNEESRFMNCGGAAVASFKDIKVKKIEITVSDKWDNANAAIKLSDIVVLGKGE